MSSTTILSAHDLSIGYTAGNPQHLPVFAHLDFELCAGELVCMLGANGVGKSTLLRTLSAAQPPLSGTLSLLGRPMSAYNEKELSRMIGVVLTDKTQTGGLTVRELVALGRQPYTGFLGILSRNDRERVEEALHIVGIEAKAQRYVAELSDGERQKAMIAMTLVQECPLILLDEPTAFLDVVSCLDMMTLLHRLANEENKAILLSTHNVEQALALADRLWLLSKEKTFVAGTTEDVILSDAMNDLFKHSHVVFDKQRGNFYATPENARTLRIKAGNATLLYWTVNALQRMGFTCLTDSTASSANLPLAEVEALSDTQLVFRSATETQTFASFEFLLRYLAETHRFAQ